MVVEDDEAVLDVTVMMLRSAGFRVLTASDGNEALEVCRKEPDEIHLLLTDVVMPYMSGSQLAERLRMLRPGLRIVYMSGYVEDAIARRGLQDPTAKFLAKPFTSAQLLRKVREALDYRPGN